MPLPAAFDEVYCQPTGEVPLVGLGELLSPAEITSRPLATRTDSRSPHAGSTTPFFGRLAKWLGIEVHAEARNEYKSFVQPASHSLCRRAHLIRARTNSSDLAPSISMRS